MDSNRLQYLFDSYRKSTCTKEELEELNEWYENQHTGQIKIEDLITKAGGEDQLADQLYHNFSRKVSEKRKLKFTVRRWSVAAAAIILFATFLVFFRITKDEQSKPVMSANTLITPGKNKAILTLADGSQIDLDNAVEGEIYNANGISISKTDSGSLTYLTKTLLITNELQMKFNEIYVPRGGQYMVTLPDGTKVWINSASTLRFPITSNGRDRAVLLSGEGYFEVAHNKQLPFKVKTADQEVQVLGTHFNIKGYEEEGFVSTTLVEGSVKINQLNTGSSKILAHGQQAITGKQKNDIDIYDVNIKQALAWKDGHFIFDNQDIQSIMKAISRWYDVDVKYVNGISEERFGGTFSRHSNLSDILENLQELGDVNFLVKDRMVIISKVAK